MAIAFDANSQGETNSATSLTVSHTCTGSDRVLIVAVDIYVDGVTLEVPTATYNGVSMTEITNIVYGLTGDSQRLTLFRLVAPATGANDIVISAASTQNELNLTAVSYTGVDQTTPVDTASTNVNDDTTSTTMDISSATDDLVIDAVSWYNGSITVGSGQTERVFNDNGSGNDSVLQSDEPGAGTVTMSHSWSAGEYSGHIAVNLNIASAAVQDITPGLVQLNPGAFNPTIDSTIDMAPGLVQQLIQVFGPTIEGKSVATISFPANWSNQHLPITITGTATDGDNVDNVQIRVYSRDQAVYWDGSAWATSTPIYLNCVVDSPGAGTTNWSYTFNPPDRDASNQAYWCPVHVIDGNGDVTGNVVAVNFYSLVDNLEPALMQNLITNFAPAISSSGVEQFLTPGLEAQLVVAFDPSFLFGAVDITPGLKQQLAQAFNPTLAPGAVDISPSLKQILAIAFTTTVDPGSVDITPALKQQLVVPLDPSLATGSVNIDPGLMQQLALAIDPALSISGGTQDISPALFQKLFASFGPSLDVGAVNIDPAIKAQLINAFDPSFVMGAVNINPSLAVELVNAFSPLTTPGAVTIDLFNPYDRTLTPDLYPSFGNHFSQVSIGSEFTSTEAIEFVAVLVDLYKTGTPTDNLTLTIYDGTDPTTDSILATSVIDGSTLGTAQDVVIRFDLSAPVSLPASIAYCWTLVRSGGVDSSNYYFGGRSTASVFSDTVAMLFSFGAWGTGSYDRSFELASGKGFVESLFTSFDPSLVPGVVNIAPNVSQQLALPFEIDLYAVVNTSPDLIQQLTVSMDLVVTSEAFITPVLTQELIVGYDPVLAPGVVDISLGLFQQLIMAFDPMALQGVFVIPNLANQSILAYDPTIDLGPGAVQDVSPDRIQQIISAIDPALGTNVFITMDFLQQLIGGFGPDVGGDGQPKATTTMSDWSG